MRLFKTKNRKGPALPIRPMCTLCYKSHLQVGCQQGARIRQIETLYISRVFATTLLVKHSARQQDSAVSFPACLFAFHAPDISPRIINIDVGNPRHPWACIVTPLGTGAACYVRIILCKQIVYLILKMHIYIK